MKSYNIAVIGGDGTGPEVTREAVKVLDAAAKKKALELIPMRRFGRPEEVAAAIRFLASVEAGYITGSALKIDGGIL